jgi:hypothetical protein
MQKQTNKAIKVIGIAMSVIILLTAIGVPMMSAYAASHITYDMDNLYYIHFYDASGNEIFNVSTSEYIDQVPPRFYDTADGTEYHCVEPFADSYQPNDLKDPRDATQYYTPKLGKDRAKEFVRQLGYMWKWSDEHYSGDEAGIVKQILIWQIEFNFGLKSENYSGHSYNDNHRQVEYTVVDMSRNHSIDSREAYNSFIAYYNALPSKGQGTGTVMVTQDGKFSQKVGRFGVIENGYVTIQKNLTM